ncbi:energy-coupling factor ABC transporter substrate-binding protein [uncultured Dechloromonas sp.]|uniref:energy-coupling factor ABC transporter substrate-binding protein n=1 Tax=uncultured Dechloromonas sp. TaxID=171719 RepID=UPI0025D03857|nr:energy-coupling factor ABC transporter substrate-binding protein [uncultured Dechloromonas sp.]
MKRRTVLLLLAVALLTALPLWLVHKPAPGGELFGGSDAQGQQAIVKLAPDYRPWFESLLTPPGKEIESLLFALQAALGAGIIGYWLGVSVTREKFRRAAEKDRHAP